MSYHCTILVRHKEVMMKRMIGLVIKVVSGPLNSRVIHSPIIVGGTTTATIVTLRMK